VNGNQSLNIDADYLRIVGAAICTNAQPATVSLTSNGSIEKESLQCCNNTVMYVPAAGNNADHYICSQCPVGKYKNGSACVVPSSCPTDSQAQDKGDNMGKCAALPCASERYYDNETNKCVVSSSCSKIDISETLTETIGCDTGANKGYCTLAASCE
jgi:hypothetical protein